MNNQLKRIFLKPCPLCGSAPELHTYQCDPWGDGGGYATAYFYQCTGCEYIRMPERVWTRNHNHDEMEEDAKQAWNETVKNVLLLMKERLGEE